MMHDASLWRPWRANQTWRTISRALESTFVRLEAWIRKNNDAEVSLIIGGNLVKTIRVGLCPPYSL